MIVSTVQGRIRVRAPRLKSARFGREAVEAAAALDGVLEARHNRGAGCLIVSYDPQTVETEALEDQLEAICTERAEAVRAGRSPLSRRLNQATKVGMMASLATSLTYGFLGRKKEHIAFGTVFVALAGAHMVRYQRTLVR
ncbi:MAG: hypothetical protein RIB45_02200 [Marivibrio sp.]|uniref:hypothetical protein n=1 Tax=Marivibrio sp. TaxID=2039719 RepID=UPI0032EB6A6C